MNPKSNISLLILSLFLSYNSYVVVTGEGARLESNCSISGFPPKPTIIAPPLNWVSFIKILVAL